MPATSACFPTFIKCAGDYYNIVAPLGPLEGVHDIKDALSSYAVGVHEEEQAALKMFASIRLYPVEAAFVLTMVSLLEISAER